MKTSLKVKLKVQRVVDVLCPLALSVFCVCQQTLRMFFVVTPLPLHMHSAVLQPVFSCCLFVICTITVKQSVGMKFLFLGSLQQCSNNMYKRKSSKMRKKLFDVYMLQLA